MTDWQNQETSETSPLFRSLDEQSATIHRRVEPHAVTSHFTPGDTANPARRYSASFDVDVAVLARRVERTVCRRRHGCLRDVPRRQRCAAKSLVDCSGGPLLALCTKKNIYSRQMPYCRPCAEGSVPRLSASVTCRPIARRTTRRKGVGAQLAHVREGHNNEGMRDWPALRCQTRRRPDSVARERDETVARWSRSRAKLRRE
jgi:hypothetical protein